MPGRHVQSSSQGTSDLSLLNNWPASAYVFSLPAVLSLSPQRHLRTSYPPIVFFSPVLPFSPSFVLFLSYFLSPPTLSFFSLSITLRLPGLWIVKVAVTYRCLCNLGDKEGRHSESIRCETSSERRGISRHVYFFRTISNTTAAVQ